MRKGGASVLRQFCQSDLRLSRYARAGTASVLIQQLPVQAPSARLQTACWRSAIFRSGLRDPESRPVAGRRRDSWLGSSQFLLLLSKCLSLAEHYKFDVDAPWASLSANVHKVVLYGSGKENIEFKYMRTIAAMLPVRRHPFEGVLHNMAVIKRRNPARCAKSWRSSSVIAPAPAVKERDWNREARHVFVGNYAAACYFRDMSIGHAMDFFTNLSLSGQRAKIAGAAAKRSAIASSFWVNVA